MIEQDNDPAKPYWDEQIRQQMLEHDRRAMEAIKLKCLSSYISRMGDRRVKVSLWDNGDYVIEWTIKTSYRTKRVTKVRVTAKAMHMTLWCAIRCARVADKPFGWDPSADAPTVSRGPSEKEDSRS